MEEYRNIKDFEGYYQISNKGNVLSLERRIWNGNSMALFKQQPMKLYKDDKQRVYVILSKERKVKRCCVARLVAFAFPEICGEYFEGAECNHLNEMPWDNRAENLHWCTSKENINWGTRNERNSISSRNRTDMSKIVLQYDKQMNFIKEYPSVNEAARQTGINFNSISRCCRCVPHCKTAGGYIWKFKETV